MKKGGSQLQARPAKERSRRAEDHNLRAAARAPSQQSEEVPSDHKEQRGVGTLPSGSNPRGSLPSSRTTRCRDSLSFHEAEENLCVCWAALTLLVRNWRRVAVGTQPYKYI